MRKRNSVTKNAAYMIAGKTAQALLGLAVSMISARYLGPSGYGIISYAASVVAFAVPLMKLGYGDILVNDIVSSPEDEGEILGTAIFFNALSALACTVGVAAFVCVADRGEKTTLIVCVLYSTNLLFQATEMIQYWYQARLMSQYTSLVSFIAYAAVSAYRIFLLISGRSIYLFAVSNALDYLLISAALIVLYRRLGAKKLSVSIKRGRDMFSRGKYFMLSSILVTVFVQTDRIMIKAMLGETQLGLYSAALTCATLTSFAFAALIDSVRPAALEKRKLSEDAFEHDMIMCYSAVIWLSLAQAVLFTVFASPIIRLLFGDGYRGSAGVLRLVVWYTAFSYIGAVRNIWILAEDKQKYLLPVNLMGAAANVVLNALTIPAFGIMGAAFSTVATQFFTNVIVGYIIKPIRYNNTLMLGGLDPRPLAEFIKKLFMRLS